MIVSLANQGESSNAWYIDSGPSQHMTYKKNIFSSLEETKGAKIFLGDDSSHDIEGIGTISMKGNDGKNLEITNVNFVPRLAKNLLSMSQIEVKHLQPEENTRIIIKKDHIKITELIKGINIEIIKDNGLNKEIIKIGKLIKGHKMNGEIIIITIKDKTLSNVRSVDNNGIKVINVLRNGKGDLIKEGNRILFKKKEIII